MVTTSQHRANVRADMEEFLRTNPNGTFQDMLKKLAADGRTFSGDIVREYAAECGLLRRFKDE